MSVQIWNIQLLKVSDSHTSESSQFDTAGHVVVEEDSSSFAVALHDGAQSLRTDAVTWVR